MGFFFKLSIEENDIGFSEENDYDPKTLEVRHFFDILNDSSMFIRNVSFSK